MNRSARAAGRFRPQRVRLSEARAEDGRRRSAPTRPRDRPGAGRDVHASAEGEPAAGGSWAEVSQDSFDGWNSFKSACDLLVDGPGSQLGEQ